MNFEENDKPESEEDGGPLPAYPGEEKPRFVLLPEGCKNLTDAYGVEFDFSTLHYERMGPPVLKEVVLPDSISVMALAALLQVQVFQLVKELIPLNIIADAETYLEFEEAAALSLKFGFVGLRAS
ncbi:MAG TPA: hypothetical protein VK956_04260 [Verrucomicrobium sp.]|nr:hypothetical protein [Verrucomicrobium sp.]